MKKLLVLLLSGLFVTFLQAQSWEELQKVLPEPVEHSIQYGNSVAIEGSIAVVGARFFTENDSQVGKAFILERVDDVWVKRATLEPSEILGSTQFGYSVAISNDVIVVGAINEFREGGSTGAAYVFVKPAMGWEDMTQSARLTPADGELYVEFGLSVDIQGDLVVVGAPSINARFGNFTPGAAYIFEKPSTGWEDMNQTAILTSSDRVDYDFLGWPVAIDNETIFLGAPGRDELNLTNSGAAYMYQKPVEGGWIDAVETAKLVPSQSVADSNFGSAIDLENDVAIVGARGFEGPGEAFIYEKGENGWVDMVETAKLLNLFGQDEDDFGISVAIQEDMVVVGGGIINEGAFHTYSKPIGGWTDVSQVSTSGASDQKIGDFFAGDLAIFENVIVIGASGVDDINDNAGAVYFFERNENIINVAATNPDGSYAPNDQIDIAVSFSDVVTVSGEPTILLETGNVDRRATYVSGSGSNSLIFSYTIQGGDQSEDLGYVSTNALDLNGGTIQSSSNPLDTSLPEPGTARSLSGNADIVVLPSPLSSQMFLSGVLVFPTPTNDLVTIRTKSATLTELLVYDASGNTISRTKFSKKDYTLSTKDWSAGIYFLKIRNEEGSFTKRLVRR